MWVIIGLVVVFGSIIGGFLMEKGNLLVLMQPAELIIIGGAALGTIFIANPMPTIIRMGKGILSALAGSRYNKKFYMETLTMLGAIFQTARKQGLAKLETDVDDPGKSPLFTKYPKFLKDHHALDFVCDTLRVAVTGGVGAYEIDQVMEIDMEAHHAEAHPPVAALQTVADALPGLGIVAAVLGVVITMGALGGPPEEIGHKVAAALVGTFLGILLCYGVFGPVSSKLAGMNNDDATYYQCLRTGLSAFIKGAPPLLAVEFARRSLPHQMRPSFKDAEAAVRSGKSATPEAPASSEAA
jgi:chemotaxis protein MotA